MTVTVPCDLRCEFCGVGGRRNAGLAGPPRKRSVMSSPNVASMSGLTKERHDRVLYVLVWAVMRALGLRFPSPYKTLGVVPNLVSLVQTR